LRFRSSRESPSPPHLDKRSTPSSPTASFLQNSPPPPCEINDDCFAPEDFFSTFGHHQETPFPPPPMRFHAPFRRTQLAVRLFHFHHSPGINCYSLSRYVFARLLRPSLRLAPARTRFLQALPYFSSFITPFFSGPFRHLLELSRGPASSPAVSAAGGSFPPTTLFRCFLTRGRFRRAVFFSPLSV